MSAPSTQAIIAALGHLGISVAAGNLHLVDGYDNTAIAAHQGTWAPAYVVLHDTGTGIPTSQLKPAQSLGWLVHNEYAPIRAAHFLIGRDGVVHFVYAYACYHAGNGGPYGPHAGTPGDTDVALDVMNPRAYGIEHESSGTPWDLTPAQVVNGAKTAAALLYCMGKGVENALNHKDWTDQLQKDGTTRPGRYAGRKVDTRQSRSWWWDQIRPHLGKLYAKPTPPQPVIPGPIAPPPDPRPPAPKPPWPTWHRLLRQGSIGADVKELQHHLPSIKRGFGIYGGGTTTAVKAAQAAHHLPVTGKVDQATWRTITGHA